MSSLRFKKKWNGPIFFVFILAIFIVGFMSFNHFYGLKKTETFVLNKSLFQTSSPTNDDMNPKLEDVSKLNTPYPIWSPAVVDDQSILFSTANRDGKQADQNILYKLNTTNHSKEMIYDHLYNGLTVSPDGKILLFSSFDHSTEMTKTHLYDLQTKQITKTFTGFPWKFSNDNTHYVGEQNGTIFINDINTEERKELINRGEASSELYKLAKALQTVKLFNFIFSPDGNKVYFMGYSAEGTGIYSVHLKNNTLMKVINFDGAITKLVPLADGNLLLSGSIKGEKGLFLLNPSTQKYKHLIHGTINNFDINPDGKLAYTMVENGDNLHAAMLKKDTINYDEVLYRGLEYCSFIKWSQSGNTLFCISDQINESSIYRFTFLSD
ncbi:hypothetical protein [Neobacillus muris]|uniref:hypothetical protein n=1 Tax=Neobacillus muris TaxID=2941334 RepID=UPI00203C9BC8|nr:hypothetical protein [Neobacillus muris]